MTSAHAAETSVRQGRPPAGECNCTDRRRSRVLTAIVVVAPLAAAAVRGVDWLTPALSGVLPFRVRIGGGLALLALLASTALVSIRQRHRVTPRDNDGPAVHYL